jgi:DNA-binding GntR family transcriptional regulator
MRESYELRLMLEVRSIERSLPLAPATLEKLQSCVTTMSAAVGSGDSEHYIDAALDFHRSLVEMGGNGTFLKLWDSLHWEVRGRIALRRRAAVGGGLAPMVALHMCLMRSLRAGDAARAVEDVKAILQSVSDAFREA